MVVVVVVVAVAVVHWRDSADGMRCAVNLSRTLGPSIFVDASVNLGLAGGKFLLEHPECIP